MLMLADLAEKLPPTGGLSVGADNRYDTQEFIDLCREMVITPRHPGYALSQRVRKLIEEIFGWMKTVGGFRRTWFKGKRPRNWQLTSPALPTT